MGACNLLDYGQLTTVKRCICWPESHDRMAGSARPAISFELIADLSLCFQLVPKGHVLSQVMGSWWSVDLWIFLQWFQVHCSTNWDRSFAFSCGLIYTSYYYFKNISHFLIGVKVPTYFSAINRWSKLKWTVYAYKASSQYSTRYSDFYRPPTCRTNVKEFLILFQGPRIEMEFSTEQHQRRPKV